MCRLAINVVAGIRDRFRGLPLLSLLQRLQDRSRAGIDLGRGVRAPADLHRQTRQAWLAGNNHRVEHHYSSRCHGRDAEAVVPRGRLEAHQSPVVGFTVSKVKRSEPDKRISVGGSDFGPREYELHELIWLWRTAELPHDAEYQNEHGEWRPIAELVEPIIKAQDEARPKPTVRPPKARSTGRIWKFAAFGVALLALLAAPYVIDFVAKRNARQAEDAHIAKWEQSERIEDFIANRQVVVGMKPEHVLRAWGKPSKKATVGGREQWIYGKRSVTFSKGIVSGIHNSP